MYTMTYTMVLCSSFRKKTFPVFNNKRVLLNPYPLKETQVFERKYEIQAVKSITRYEFKNEYFGSNSNKRKEFVSLFV